MTPQQTMTQNALGGSYLGGKSATPSAATTAATGTVAETQAAQPDAMGSPAAPTQSHQMATAPAQKYSMADYVNRITGLKNAGQGQQAYQMFNGLTQGQYGAGALDSALRQAWGDSAAKQWINQGDVDYHGHGFDPTKDNAALGWQASQFDPNAGKQWMTDWYNSGGGDAANTAASDAWVKNWAQSVGGKGFSPTQNLMDTNAQFQASHGMDAQGNVTGVGQNNGQPMPGAAPTTGAGSGLAAGGGYNPTNTQNMPGPSPAPPPRQTNRFDQPSQPSSVYSTTRNLANRPMTLGGGSLGGGMGRPLRATDI